MKIRLPLLVLFLATFFISSCDDSTDSTSVGNDWTWHPLLTGPALNAIADDGISFVVVGDGYRIQASVDGRSWRVLRASEDFVDLNDVVRTAGTQIAVGESGFVAVDSETSFGAAVIPGTPELLGVTASDSILVVVGADGFIASSPTGNDWTPRASPTQATLEDVRWNGTVFVAVGRNGTIVVSPDGLSWAQVQSGTQQDLTAVTEGPLKTWLAVGPEGTVVRSLFPDASEWEGVIETLTLSFNDVVWTGARFVSVGSGGYVGESSDNGRTWFKETSHTTQDLRRLVSSHGRLIAVGTGTTILVSEQPGSWEAVNPGAGFNPSEAIWTGSRFVVVGGPSILTSLDGSAWSESYHERVLLRGIAQSPSRLVAVGIDLRNGPLLGVMVGSIDGVQWSPIPGALTDQSYLDVAWGDPGFLAVSQGLDGALSSDGQTWNRVAFPAEFYRVAWGNGTYLALGTNVMGLSTNGTDWDNVSYPFETNGSRPHDLNWLEGKFWLAGPGDHISTSTDGRNWDVQVTGSGIDIVAVTRRGAWIYATGGYGTILASSNFQTWTEQESGTTNELRRLVANDHTVLALGVSGTILSLD